MPTWTLRLVAFAGLVALLGRLPAVDSVAEAFVMGSVAAAAALALTYGPALLRHLHGRLVTAPRPLPLRLVHHHGPDA